MCIFPIYSPTLTHAYKLMHVKVSSLSPLLGNSCCLIYDGVGVGGEGHKGCNPQVGTLEPPQESPAQLPDMDRMEIDLRAALLLLARKPSHIDW